MLAQVVKYIFVLLTITYSVHNERTHCQSSYISHFNTLNEHSASPFTSAIFTHEIQLYTVSVTFTCVRNHKNVWYSSSHTALRGVTVSLFATCAPLNACLSVPSNPYPKGHRRFINTDKLRGVNWRLQTAQPSLRRLAHTSILFALKNTHKMQTT